jgi:predicted component of viral defense system (DUF524 family)
MGTNYVLATLVAATLPLIASNAEDSEKTEATDQTHEQTHHMMGQDQMMCNWKDQDAELDKLVTDMNSATADKKLDVIAAVLNKLVEQRKTMHEQMQKMMSASEGERVGMCQMMMGAEGGGAEDTHHH